ncbi:MAG: hypothetical protein AB1468_01245 [Candidatus Micrarchaeota archaeon]
MHDVEPSRGSGWTRLSSVEIYYLIARINDENGTHIKLISPKLADSLLNEDRAKNSSHEKGNQNYRFFFNFSPFPVDAIIAYENDRPLGAEIVFANLNEPAYRSDPRLIMPTYSFSGASGVALAVLDLVEPDFKKDGRDIRINVPESRLIVVEDFKSDDGWRMPEPRTRIPQGKIVSEDTVGARMLKDNPLIGEENTIRGYYENNPNYVGPIAMGGERPGRLYFDLKQIQIETREVRHNFRAFFEFKAAVLQIPADEVKKFLPMNEPAMR